MSMPRGVWVHSEPTPIKTEPFVLGWRCEVEWQGEDRFVEWWHVIVEAETKEGCIARAQTIVDGLRHADERAFKGRP